MDDDTRLQPVVNWFKVIATDPPETTVAGEYKAKLKAWDKRRAKARELRSKGKTWREIAEALSEGGSVISPQAARKLGRELEDTK